MVRIPIALLVCSGLAWAQRPSDADAAALIERAREKALAYTKSLPDFECTEIVKRSGLVNPKLMRLRAMPNDKLTIRIRYSHNLEEHRLMLIDDEPTNESFETLPGSVGTGEFGATFSAIFQPATATRFEWVSSGKSPKQPIAVYRYEVDGDHSAYHLWDGGIGSGAGTVVGYHGILEIDSETGEVLHFSYIADHLPKRLSIRSASTTVDYAFADVGGQKYLLPAKSVTEVNSVDGYSRNEMHFREYHKFVADSSIEFGPVK